MTQREEFERWFKYDFHPDKTGPYVKDQLWFAWQAAKATSFSLPDRMDYELHGDSVIDSHHNTFANGYNECLSDVIAMNEEYANSTGSDGWNERVSITGERTQVQEIAAWLAKQDNGADSALILAFEREHAELLSLVKDLKACLLSMTPTEFTDAEFCIATLDKTNKIILKHSGA